MLTEMIEPKVKQTIQNYEDQIIEDIWEIHTPLDHNQPVNTTYFLNQKISSAKQMVCIVSNEELHYEIQRTIQQISERGIRVYLLTNQNYTGHHNTIVGKCLTRYNRFFVGTIVLIDPTIQGDGQGFMTSSTVFSDQDAFHPIVDLSFKQLNEAYEFFIWNFWKEADYEIKTREEALQPGIVQDPPFDLFPLVKPKFLQYNKQSVSLLTDQIIVQLQQSSSSIYIMLEDLSTIPILQQLLLMKAEQGIQISVFTKPNKRNFIFLQSLVKQGAAVFGYDSIKSPFILIDGKDGVIFTDSSLEKHTFGFKMDPQDVYQLSKIVNIYQSSQRIQLYSSKKLGEIQSRQILLEENAELYNETEYSIVRDEAEIDLGKLIAPRLRDLLEENLEPSFSHDGLVKKVNYSWEIAPKTRDDKATRDPLYADWNREVDRFKEYLLKIKQVANYSEERKKSLSEKAEHTFNMLKRFFLGKSQLSTEIIENVDKLITILNANHILRLDDVEKMVRDANEWAQKIEVSKEEIETEIDKSEQELEWNKRRESILGEIESLNGKINDLMKEKDTLQDEKIAIRTERNTELDEITQKLDKASLQIEKIRSEHSLEIEFIQTKETFSHLFKQIDKGFLDLRAKKKKPKELKKVYERLIKELSAEMEKIGKLELLNSIIEHFKDGEEDKNLTTIKKELANHPVLKTTEESFTNFKSVIDEYNDCSKKVDELESKKKELDKAFSILESSYMEKEKKVQRQLDDITSSINRKNDDLEKLGKTFSYKPSEISKGDDSLKAMFKKNNTSAKGNSKNDTLESFQSNWPKQELPAIGTLYSLNQNRQLAISMWKDLEIGEKESFRLGADLVVERNDRK
ncbi:hypothetical protein ACFSO7_01145 [Bacillus sp. CGMCC 1.16607]|uniref:hypothetical protein n=1 Tax=Bacillus sp. CGMCC 1.16607 TaxID=3351842 RepID=UPI0036326D97